MQFSLNFLYILTSQQERASDGCIYDCKVRGTEALVTTLWSHCMVEFASEIWFVESSRCADILLLLLWLTEFVFLDHFSKALPYYSWRAPWKNRICSSTMKLRKSLVKPVTWQKTCTFSSCSVLPPEIAMLFSVHPPIYASCMTISSGRTEQLNIIVGFLPHHWLYKWFSSAENVRRYMRCALRSRGGRTEQHIVVGFGELAAVD